MTSTDIYVPVIEHIKQRKTTKQFIKEAIEVHGNKFSYDLVNYITSKIKVKILCNTCLSIFDQNPASHTNGIGCKNCHIKSTILTTNKFISLAIETHGTNYDYSLTTYIDNKTNIKIKCNKCGTIFKQRPANHLQGRGCIKCCTRISKISTEWLKSLNIDSIILEHILPEILRSPVDGYDPLTNTVYQFHGDYWHGNPNNQKFKPEDIHPVKKITYNELYYKTLDSDAKILSYGYNLVTMWEYDFKSSTFL